MGENNCFANSEDERQTRYLRMSPLPYDVSTAALQPNDMCRSIRAVAQAAVIERSQLRWHPGEKDINISFDRFGDHRHLV